MTTSILVAYDKNRAIGANGDLPWGRRGLQSDLARFKELTTANTVIMGRKTYDSIGQPLPNRENIVISRNPHLDIDGIICVNSLASAISAATKEVFVIGGAQIFEEALPVTDKILASEVDAIFPNTDTFFPEIDKDEWDEISREPIPKGKSANDLYDYDFVIYERKH